MSVESEFPRCPWAEAERRGVTVYLADLKGLSGLHAGEGVIYLEKTMTDRDLRSTLWHELGHEARGEVMVPDTLCAKSERAADLYAAEQMVDPARLRELATLYPDDPSLIAYELSVADWVLEVYLRAHPEFMQALDEAA